LGRANDINCSGRVHGFTDRQEFQPEN
jgi:hypothetical protein